MPLARAIVEFLLQKRRTEPDTRDTIERDFRPAAVAAKYRALYRGVQSRGRRVMRGSAAPRRGAPRCLRPAPSGWRSFYGRSPALHVDFDVEPPRGIVDGVYPAERDRPRD